MRCYDDSGDRLHDQLCKLSDADCRADPAERFQAAQAALEAAIRDADWIDPADPAADRQAVWQRVADAGTARDAALAAVRAVTA